VLNDGHDVAADHKPMIDRSRRLGRVFAAATRTGGAEAFARLYDVIGTRLHIQGDDLGPQEVAKSLTEAGLDPGLAEHLDSTSLDDDITGTHEVSQAALGSRGGSPIVVVDGRGFNGPVLTEQPRPDRGRDLLDALVTAATTPGFAALQRPYQGPPKIDAATEETH
ncbi:mycothiol-dependent nitroreductase Rv2466c family protein, partial [Mycolicibacterium thermoresistibile]